MAKRGFKASEVVAKEALEELEQLRKELNAQSQSDQPKAQVNAQSRSNAQANAQSTTQANARDLLIEVSRVMRIATLGCSGLHGVAVRVYADGLEPVPHFRLFNKRNVELAAEDVIIEAFLTAELRGYITVYRVEGIAGEKALIRRVAMIAPNGAFMGEAFVPDEIRPKLVILSKQAMSAAMRELKKSREPHNSQKEFFAPRRQNRPFVVHSSFHPTKRTPRNPSRNPYDPYGPYGW
jgi:DNA-binding transcriptional regulator GbsR (MarR family)